MDKEREELEKLNDYSKAVFGVDMIEISSHETLGEIRKDLLERKERNDEKDIDA